MLTMKTTTQENWKVNEQTQFNSKNTATQCQMKHQKLQFLITRKRKDKHLNILTSLREQMSSKKKRLNDIIQEQGSSSWLSVFAI